MTTTELPRHIYLCTRVHPDYGRTWVAFDDVRRDVSRTPEPGSVVMSERTRDAAKRWLRSVVGFGYRGEDGLDHLLSCPAEDVYWTYIQRVALIRGAVPDPVGAPSLDRTRWQVTRIASDGPMEAVNQLGNEGWEPFGTASSWVYFRRPITG